MNNRFLYRIITFESYPDYGTPRSLLAFGSATINLPPKQRYYAIRQVFYDDDMTPMYAVPDPYEKRYASPQELLEANPNRSPLKDSPILDQSNYLKVYNNETQGT
jgi:hypothetical protein